MNPKPFIKWSGGKQRTLKHLIQYLPNQVSIYCEPFLGAGSVAIHIASEFQPFMMLGDINTDLIATWLTVIDTPDSLFIHLQDSCYTDFSRDNYLHQRRLFNNHQDRTPWNFLYLMKAGFNGIYRENLKGEFNVPFGDGLKKNIIDEKNLLKLSTLFNQAIFVNWDFESTLDIWKWNLCMLPDKTTKDPFVYCDPPYRGSCFSYSKQKFNDDSRFKLKNECDLLTEIGVKVMVSEADDDFNRDLWSNWNIYTIQRPGTINSDSKNRKKVSELVIRNY